MVGLILAFVFLVPRDVFKDQPKAANVVMLPGESYFLEPELLQNVPEAEWVSRASNEVKAKFKPNKPVTHVEPIYDNEEKVIGYAASLRP